MIIKKKHNLFHDNFKNIIIIPILFIFLFAGVIFSDDIKNAYIKSTGFFEYLLSEKINDDPLIYYSFNNANESFVYDESGHKHNGLIKNGQIIRGKQGLGINLKGNGYIEINNTDMMNTKTFSVCFWMKSNDKKIQYIIAKVKDNTPLWRVFMNAIGKIEFDAFGEVGNIQANKIGFDEWEHICCIFDGSRAKIYHNSRLAGTSSPNLNYLNREDGKIVIGSNSMYPYNGSLDEIRIYNRALSEKEIESLYYLKNPKNYEEKKLDELTIDISPKDYQKILNKRKEAFKAGVLLSSDDDFVPANLTFNGEKISAKIRLKGDMLDQLMGKKWSYRIEIKDKNKRIFGMKKFSIQSPKVRHGVYEWIFHKALEYEGLIHLRYYFINVTINNVNLGTYALEEHFDKYLIENNHLREGPIIKFNEELLHFSLFWNHKQIEMPYLTTKIDGFKLKSVLENQKDSFIIARNLLELLRTNQLKTSDVFDVEKYAKYRALLDVLGMPHPNQLHNMRFYYNPITSKLEPVGFDAENCRRIEYIMYGDYFYDKEFQDIIFNDTKFFKAYVKELERMANKEYIDNLIDKLKQEGLETWFKLVPNPPFSKQNFYYNIELINRLLNPKMAIHVFLEDFNKNNSVMTLSIGTFQKLPLEILSISYNNVEISKLSKDNILGGYNGNGPVVFKKFYFKMPSDFKIKDINKLRVHYRVLGSSYENSEIINPWPQSYNDTLNDVMRQKQNINEFNFLVTDEKTKSIIIKQGEWTINKNLIIPKNYNVFCDSNTTIILANNSKIISYSPIQFLGAEEEPIKIISNGGQGLVILNTNESSNIDYTIFYNLTAPSEGGWELSGAVTFYESPVNITNSKFLSGRSEDSLNLIRSQFNIKNTVFQTSFSDCLDGDFVQGTISNTKFYNCGNDGIDLSGSIVTINSVLLNNISDKGISAGEGSLLYINNPKIKNSFIGLASKDLSIINLNSATISNTEYDFAVYQKKAEYGPASINANVSSINNKYIVEENSNLTLNGLIIEDKQQNVYETLYGD